MRCSTLSGSSLVLRPDSFVPNLDVDRIKSRCGNTRCRDPGASKRERGVLPCSASCQGAEGPPALSVREAELASYAI